MHRFSKLEPTSWRKQGQCEEDALFTISFCFLVGKKVTHTNLALCEEVTALRPHDLKQLLKLEISTFLHRCEEFWSTFFYRTVNLHSWVSAFLSFRGDLTLEIVDQCFFVPNVNKKSSSWRPFLIALFLICSWTSVDYDTLVFFIYLLVTRVLVILFKSSFQNMVPLLLFSCIFKHLPVFWLCLYNSQLKLVFKCMFWKLTRHHHHLLLTTFVQHRHLNGFTVSSNMPKKQEIKSMSNSQRFCITMLFISCCSQARFFFLIIINEVHIV